MKDIVYDIPEVKATAERHILAVLVDNEFGVLARVIGLFSARGYNIESLTVAEVEHARNLSRITIVTSATPMVMEQIKRQLERLVPVHKVHDLTVEGPQVERELALIKVNGSGDMRAESLRTADIFHARVVDSTPASFIFEITGSSEKLDAFTDALGAENIIEICRTGIAAMARGASGV